MTGEVSAPGGWYRDGGVKYGIPIPRWLAAVRDAYGRCIRITAKAAGRALLTRPRFADRERSSFEGLLIESADGRFGHGAIEGVAGRRQGYSPVPASCRRGGIRLR